MDILDKFKESCNGAVVRYNRGMFSKSEAHAYMMGAYFLSMEMTESMTELSRLKVHFEEKVSLLN